MLAMSWICDCNVQLISSFVDLESREKAANVGIEADLTLKKNLQAEVIH